MSDAQTYHIKQELLGLFEDQSSEVWVTTYMGLEHYAYPVDFLLARGSTGYRAISYYKDSGDKYYYENNSTTDRPGTLSEYDAQGRYTGAVTLHEHEDYIEAVWMSAEKNNVMSTILIEDKIGKATFPELAKVLAARYEGVLFDQVTDLKLYRDREHIDIHISNSQGAETLTLLPTDFTRTKYGLGAFTIFGESLDSIGLTMQDGAIQLEVHQSGKKSTSTLQSSATVTSQQTTWSSPHVRYMLARPDISGKRFNQWLDERAKVAAKTLSGLQSKEENGEYGMLDRNVDWAGMDVQIKFLDTEYISGDVYVFGDQGVECTSFVYDISKDQLLEQEDVVDRSKMNAEFAKEVADMPHLMLQDSGLLFQGAFDMIAGSPRASLSYEDIAKTDKRILKNRSIRNHFLK